MAFDYEELDEDRKKQIKDVYELPEPKVDYKAFLPAWEEEHYSHSLQCQAMTVSGEHPDEKCDHEEAMVTIETAVNNVRGDKAPDFGTEPVEPAPVDPGPTDPASK